MQDKTTTDEIIRIHKSEEIAILADIARMKNAIDDKEKRLGEIAVIIATADALSEKPGEGEQIGDSHE